MQTTGFITFLEGFATQHFIFRDLSIEDYISYCYEAEEKYSDLDTAYNKDKGKSLLEILTEDARCDSYIVQSVSCYFDFSSYLVTKSKQMVDVEKNDLEKHIQDIENSSFSADQKHILIHVSLEKSSYKTKLFELWGGCSINGSNHPELLVVKLIKPFDVCSSVEKFDIYNGLLLTPSYNKLFEEYLITFDTFGGILIDVSFTDADLLQLGVSRNDKLREEILTLNHMYYLEHHRNLFLGDLTSY